MMSTKPVFDVASARRLGIASIADRKKVSVKKSELEPKPENKKIDLGRNSFLIEEVPDKVDPAALRVTMRKNNSQMIIRNSFVSSGGLEASRFQTDKPVSMNISITVSPLLAAHRSAIKLHWVTYDLERMIVQPVMQFEVTAECGFESFRVVHHIQAPVSGYYNYRIMAEVERTGFYKVEDGGIFRVADKT